MKNLKMNIFRRARNAAATAILAGFASSAIMGAFAADPPRSPPIEPVKEEALTDPWTVKYIGIHAGVGWLDSGVNLGSFSPGLAAVVAAGVIPQSLDIDASGFLGGAQIGLNRQRGNFVFGVEADFSFMDIDGNDRAFIVSGGAPSVVIVTPNGNIVVPAVPPTNTVATANASMNWLSTLRARAGILASPKMLLYATGGFAFADMDFGISIVSNPVAGGNFNGSNDGIQTGWTVGGGVEWMINPKWTVRAEGLYFDLGEESVVISDPVNFPGSSARYDFDTTGAVARLAVNYLFPARR